MRKNSNCHHENTRSSTRWCNRKRSWIGWWQTLAGFSLWRSPATSLRWSTLWWDQTWTVGRSRHVEGGDIVAICCCRCSSKLRLVGGQKLREGNFATTSDTSKPGLLPVNLLDQGLAALLDLGKAFGDVLLLQRPVSPQLLDLLCKTWRSLLGIVAHLEREKSETSSNKSYSDEDVSFQTSLSILVPYQELCLCRSAIWLKTGEIWFWCFFRVIFKLCKAL